MIDVYTEYYLNQAGSGIGNIYSGPVYQRGYGIGSFLGGLFRSALPLLRKGSIAIGKELLTAGTNFIDDVQQNKSPKEALKQRSKETLSNLKIKAINTMKGNGYIGRDKLKNTHSTKVRRRVQSQNKILKNKSKKIDIFSS